MPRDALEDSDAFISEVCWHYFINEMTQADVAELMGVTRLRVNQAIKKARSRDLVRIELSAPFLPRIEMQAKLRSTLRLEKALVAPANRKNYEYHSAVGAALSGYLVDAVRDSDWKRIGVSWGLTIENAIRRLPPLSYPNMEVVSMLGGTTRGSSFNTFSVASGLANKLGAKYSLLAAPVYLSEGVDRSAFLRQELFEEHYAKFEQLDAVIITASDVSSKSFLIANGLPSEIDPKSISQAGAVGDVLGRFLDQDGNSIDHPIEARTIGVAIETVSTVPHKIMAAAGQHKVKIIRAAAKAGLINTLITDDITAETIIAEEEEEICDAVSG